MSIPLPLQDAITLPAAQQLLASGFASALSGVQGGSALNLTTAYAVDQQGTITPSAAFTEGLVLPGVRDLILPWFGADAWSNIQTFTNQAVNRDPAFVPSPDVVQLYQLSQVPLPAITQLQTPPPTPVPQPATGQVVPVVQPGPAPQPAPALQLPTKLPPLVGQGPLVIVPPVQGGTGVATQQPTTQWADWLRLQTGVALQEIVDHLQPVLPPIFEQQLQMTQAEADTLNAAGAILEPLVAALQDVTELMRPAQEAIDANLLTPLEQTRLELQDASARIREQVVAALGAASEAISGARTVAIEPVRQALETAQESIATVAGMLEATAAEKIANAQEAIATAMADTVSSDQALVQWFQSLIPNPDGFMQQIYSGLQNRFSNLGTPLTEILQTGVGNGLNANLNGPKLDGLRDTLNAFVTGCLSLKDFALGEAGLSLLAAVFTGGASAALELLGGLFTMLVGEGMISRILETILAPAFERAHQDAMAACPVELISMPTAASLRRMEMITDEQYTNIALKHGQDAVQRTWELQAQRALLTPADSFAYDYRKAGADRWIDQDFVKEAEDQAADLRADVTREPLRQMGFSEDDISKLIYTSHEIPGIQDLIRFATRDAFFPKIVEDFQADAEFPDQLQPFAEQQGLTAYWQHKFWQAHWELPSLTQAYEMFHRLFPTPQTTSNEPELVELPSGEKWYRGISTADLQRLMRASGLEIYWRNVIQQTAFRPLTRVDVRRAYNLDVINPDQVFANYISQGYSPENAKVLLDFSTKLKAQQNQSTLIEPQKSVARKFITAFVGGAIDESALSFALTDLGYDPQVASLTVADATMERTLKFLDMSIAAIRSRFIRGKSTQSEAHQQLQSVGIPEVEAGRYLQIWCLQVGCEGEDTVAAQEKQVTKAEILSFYDDGLISRESATQNLVTLGYTQDDAALIVANAVLKRLRANQKGTLKAIHDSYLKDTIDVLSASNELDEIGIPVETRDVLISQWREEREQAAITQAKQVFLGVGDTLVATLAILAPLDLGQDEVERLLSLWQAQKSQTVTTTTSVNGIASSG